MDPAQTNGLRILCRIDEIADNGSRGFGPDVKGAPTVFAVRRGNDVRIYRDICPHYGRTGLAWKRDTYLTADARHIVCGAHGALFRIDDGVCVAGPCLGQRLTEVKAHVQDAEVSVYLYPDRT